MKQLLTRLISASVRGVESLGAWIMGFVEGIGAFLTVTLQVLLWVFRPPMRLRTVFHHMEFIGVQSLAIVIITGAFTGGVFALQAEFGFGLFGARSLTGSTVALALTRELGPVMTALLVTGRAGSAMAAELGSMRVTEQIDAMEAMAVDPVDYLITPRFCASVLMMPALAVVFSVVGIGGAWFVGTEVLGISEGSFVHRIEWYLDPDDFLGGLYKSAVFGGIMAIVSCIRGLAAKGGAAGVGRVTTQAVVLSSVTVLIVDYFLTLWWMS
jgi:phospholipid/cholesterol/gamma-HCH transport system permease protein